MSKDFDIDITDIAKKLNKIHSSLDRLLTRNEPVMLVADRKSVV